MNPTLSRCIRGIEAGNSCILRAFLTTALVELDVAIRDRTLTAITGNRDRLGPNRAIRTIVGNSLTVIVVQLTANDLGLLV